MREIPMPNLRNDLFGSPIIVGKVQDKVYAQHLYAALCNNEFQKKDVFHILRGDKWSCSWRAAGRLVAELRKNYDNMNYCDFYCSGIAQDNIHTVDSVQEGFITIEIMSDLDDLAWEPIGYDSTLYLDSDGFIEDFEEVI